MTCRGLLARHGHLLMSPLQSLVRCGTKLWLDSIDPTLVDSNRALGATGATSNPIIVGDLLETGRFDSELDKLISNGESTEQIAWAMTDKLVSGAQRVFHPVWEETSGNDGYVSFELDPLLEDSQDGPPHARRVSKYVSEGRRWSKGQDNRMIKVPATPAGLDALEDLAAAGVPLNVTLIFSMRQYEAARDAIWRGAQRLDSLKKFKSVYSIFVSRIDVYTEKHVPQLSAAAQGQVGIVNAKRIWQANNQFWADKNLPLDQEIVFASTGTKKPSDPADKYVSAFVGSDIETNPPATNEAVQELGKRYTRTIDQLPPQSVLAEIDQHVNFHHLEDTLMEEGIKKFADPQKKLLALIDDLRAVRARD